MGKSMREKEWFIRQIGQGDTMLSDEVVERMAKQLGIIFRKCSYFCMVAQYDDAVEMTEDAERPISLFEACNSAGRKLNNDFYCYIGAGFCVVMLISDDRKERSAIANKIYNYLTKGTSKKVRIGVGRSYESVTKLNYSRVEAYEAMSIADSHAKIHYIDDIYVSRSFTTRKMEGEKRRVVELFKAGRMAEMRDNVSQLVEIIRKETPVRENMPYPTSIRRTILEIIAEFMHISSDAGIDVDATLGYEDPYNRIFEIGDTPSLLRWFGETAQKLYDSMEVLTDTVENNMLRIAKKCIEEHLADTGLSLSMVSDELGITPTYFSAFFIREVGVGFNEYITSLRINHAKELLTTTNLKIGEIAQECGFRSSSYFTVVFRKQVGMAPGEYRNMKN